MTMPHMVQTGHFMAMRYRLKAGEGLADDARDLERKGAATFHVIGPARQRTPGLLWRGLKGRIAEMQDRLDRLQDCAAKRRQIAKDVMTELDLKKITAPDFTVSVRPGMPSLLVLDEAAVPSIYWEPREPRLNRQGLASELKEGAEISGVALSNPEPVLSVRTR